MNARTHIRHVSTIFYPIVRSKLIKKMFGSCAARFYFPGQSTNGEWFRGVWTAEELTSQRHLRFHSSAERLRSTKYQAHGTEPRRLKHDLEPKPSTVYTSPIRLYVPYISLHMERFRGNRGHRDLHGYEMVSHCTISTGSPRGL